jgi:hypothetical protein
VYRDSFTFTGIEFCIFISLILDTEKQFPNLKCDTCNARGVALHLSISINPSVVSNADRLEHYTVPVMCASSVMFTILTGLQQCIYMLFPISCLCLIVLQQHNVLGICRWNVMWKQTVH